MAASMSLTSSSLLLSNVRSLKTHATPLASLSISTGSGTRKRIGSLSMNVVSNSSGQLLHCFFLSSPSSLSFPSSFSGLSLGLDLNFDTGLRKEKGLGLVVRAGKAALCQTKRNRSRKSLARTHGFRRRMRTTSGRAILKRRRAKGRKVLCTKSYPKTGKMA